MVDNTFQSSGFWAAQVHFASIGTLIVATIANITGFFTDAFLYLGFDKSTGFLTPNPQQVAPIWAMPFVFIGQFWSVGVELCFYFLAPFVAKHISLIWVLFVLSITGLLEKIWVQLCNWCRLPIVFASLQVPKLLWIFMIGAALGHVYIYKTSKPKEDLHMCNNCLCYVYFCNDVQTRTICESFLPMVVVYHSDYCDSFIICLDA
jgi:hypothetical protein